MTSEADKEHLVKQAKLAEQAERYDDMSDFMKECVKHNAPLNVEVSILYSTYRGGRFKM